MNPNFPTTDGPEPAEREVDRLRYKGYRIPALLFVVYALFAGFAIWYFSSFAWDDLAHWIARFK